MTFAGLAGLALAVSCIHRTLEPGAGTGSLPTTSSTPVPAQPAGLHFIDVARTAGLTRVVLSGRPEKDHLLDSTGTGAGFIDYDRDGDLDVYIVNGWKLSGSTIVEKGLNALYRNRGDGTFEDVTASAGVTGEGRWGSGVTVADYDDDGWPDLFVTCYGADLLYRNRGDGTFESVAARAGVESPGWNTGAAFFDADGDGDLDLYVAAYVAHGMEEMLNARRTMDWKGVDKVAPGPFGLPGAPDHFFRSDGKGAFTDATDEAGLADSAGAYGFGVRAADFDDDGDTDLYVANDSNANYLYRNDGTGRFEEVGLWSGAAFDNRGHAQAGMGLAVGDVHGDGHLDIFVTNFSEDYSTLYRGDGRGFFDDESERSGVGEPTFLPLSWGTTMDDLDNDGDLDIVVANGHIYPQVDAHPQFGMTYAQRNVLLVNSGDGHFVNAAGSSGPGFAGTHVSRGLAAGDYDNDGDIDLLITQLDGPPLLLRNDSSGGSWLTVVLPVEAGKGTLVGTRVVVEAAGRRQRRDLAAGGSFLSSHDPRLHFGLGTARTVDRLEVIWPRGDRTVLTNVPANQFLKVARPPREKP